MKIAAVSDIHGNLPALEAVLTDIARRGVDLIVNLGDLLSGPLLPRETADRLMTLDCPTLSGNHERQLLTEDLGGMGASDRFAAERITSAQRNWLAALPSTLRLSDEVFLCHATPDSDVECYLENIRGVELIPASLDEIEARSANCDASLIFCGHTHIPRVVQRGQGRVIVNSGSVGIQAYDGHHPVPHIVEMAAPHARYAIANRIADDWIIDLIAVPYDWETPARLAERHARPDWARALRTGFVRGKDLR